MGIRMSGLSSGMDTEAIVGALMSAQSLKKTKIEKQKTKLEWTQTKWADLNTKLMNLYNKYVSKMQLQASYQTKKATVSDESKASVTANSTAACGSYSMEIKNIATSQYLTGGKLSAASAKDKLVDIDSSLLNKEICVTVGDKVTKFMVTEDTTIADFTKQLTSAGLNANYDTSQQRFFISSKDSGVKNAFSITTSAVTDAEVNGRQELRDAVGYSSMTAANKTIVDAAIKTLQTSGVGTEDYDKALESLSKAAYDTKVAAANTDAATYVKAKLYGENYDSYYSKAEESLKSQYFDEEDNLLEGKTQEDYEAAVAKKADADTRSYVNTQISSDEDVKLQVEAAAFSGITSDQIQALGEKGVKAYYTALDESGNPIVNGFSGTDGYTQESLKADIAPKAEAYANITDRNSSLSQSALNSLGLADIAVDADGNATVNGGANDPSNASIPSGMALIAASDSKIILNGAELTSASTTVSANGLDIALTGLTKTDEPITFSVANDVDGVYNSIKEFVKEYNEVVKEMNTLYDADSAKGYEPLTSEQKEAMTDEDVKMWEDKVKNSLLRNDATLGNIVQSMRSAMMSQVEYDGRNYSLASFGIMTSTDYLEGGLYHIYGDEDDSVYSGQKDKLKKALSEDPDAVVNVLSGVFSNLRETMSRLMAGSKVSSALTFYSDIKMKDDIRSYEKDIKTWETRLASMEDAYYSKFTAMETALAKLQSQQSSLAGLLGG